MAEYVNEKVGQVGDPASLTSMPATSSLETKEKIELAPGVVDTVIDGAVTKDGLRVHPQPTTDPLDPLNWSPWRKHSMLAFVMIK
jgi:hypothetical protein